MCFIPWSCDAVALASVYSGFTGFRGSEGRICGGNMRPNLIFTTIALAFMAALAATPAAAVPAFAQQTVERDDEKEDHAGGADITQA